MSFDLILGLFGLTLALIFFVGMSALFGRAIVKAQSGVRVLNERIEAASAHLQIIKKQKSDMLADIEARRARVAQVIQETADLRDQTTGLILKAQMIYYVLSDRWTIADEEWIVPVRNLAMFGRSLHRGVIESWSEGRNYIVWAPRHDIVLRQVETKFPPTGGYLIGAPVPSPLKLALKWQSETTSGDS